MACRLGPEWVALAVSVPFGVADLADNPAALNSLGDQLLPPEG